MSERTVTHATFAVERSYAVPPARVFEAWADPVAKARWFGGDDWDHELDFSVGGREVSTGTMEGTSFTFEGRYQDIVPDERIVYSYEMKMDDDRISVSLATVQIEPAGDGTRLTYTEQGAYLDGLDTPEQREHGTGELLDSLGKALEGAPA